MRPIVLLTDFGLGSSFVGEMKGVIAGRAPGVKVIDLCHSVRPQAVAEGAFLLGSAYRFFPRHSVFVAVVDPGVGSERGIVALQTRHATFLAPDNGLLSEVWRQVVSRETGEKERDVSRETRSNRAGGWRLFAVTNRRMFLPAVSATFHGRDIFAPVAAYLARGLPPQHLGPRLREPRLLPLSRPEPLPGGALRCRVVYVDSFGNLVTDASASDLPRGRLRLEVAGRTIEGLSPSYAAGPELLALVNSWDRLEVARQDGSAAAELGVDAGAEVIVRPVAAERGDGEPT